MSDRDLLWWFSDTPRAIDVCSRLHRLSARVAADEASLPVRGPLKIAIVGTRGIPNRYGGFEQFAEQISSRFADHGHEVTVYCRSAFTQPDDEYDRRVKRVIVPSLHQKHLDTWFSSLLSSVHVAFSDNDVVLICNVANARLRGFRACSASRWC